jgi:hypothetical protein
MLAARAFHRGLDDAVILGTIRIGEYDQTVALMLDGIVMFRLTRADETRGRKGILDIDQPYLRRLGALAA